MVFLFLFPFTSMRLCVRVLSSSSPFSSVSFCSILFSSEGPTSLVAVLLRYDAFDFRLQL